MITNYKYFGNRNEVIELYEKAKGNLTKLPHPFKKIESDFCYDVVATSCKKIHEHVYEYGIGLGFQINKDLFIIELATAIYGEDKDGCSISQKINFIDWCRENMVIDIDLKPRSSIRDTGLILCNCVGTVDEGYTNEVLATFYHVIPDLPIYKIGDKIGQININISFKTLFLETNSFNETQRGLNGHGSSDKL